MFILIAAAVLTVLGFKFVENLTPGQRNGLLNRLGKFSAMAGWMSRLFTWIDGVRVIADWQDKWPRDHTGAVIEGARFSPPPLTVPTPINAKTTGPTPASPAGTSNPAAPTATERATGRVYTLTDMAEIAIS
mgnify:CR=1 FL=1